MEPWAEALDVAQPREFTPGEEECLLDGVLRSFRIPEDPIRDRIAQVAVQVDELLEGDIVAVACPLDQPRPHVRYSSGARIGRFTHNRWSHPGKGSTLGRSTARTSGTDQTIGGPSARRGPPRRAMHVRHDRPDRSAARPGFVDLHDRLRAGETVYGSFVGLGSPLATELIARAGFDWLMIDLEHGALTEADLLAHLYATGGTGTAAYVRPPSGERLRIGRALDLGAHGIMVPRVDLPEQAREAVSYMRYAPDGARGLALSTRGAGLGAIGHADVPGINRGCSASSRSNRPSAVEHVDEIAAIDGVDVLFVGPTDLSHSLGVPGRFEDPVYLDALRARERGGRPPRARRPGSCSTTPRSCRATASSASGSSGSVPTAPSSPAGARAMLAAAHALSAAAGPTAERPRAARPRWCASGAIPDIQCVEVRRSLPDPQAPRTVRGRSPGLIRHAGVRPRSILGLAPRHRVASPVRAHRAAVGALWATTTLTMMQDRSDELDRPPAAGRGPARRGPRSSPVRPC